VRLPVKNVSPHCNEEKIKQEARLSGKGYKKMDELYGMQL
jgi:hypothetical protein